MSDIKILKIDEQKSKPSDSNPFYVATLSAKPDQTWKNNLDSLIRRSKTAGVMNVRVSQEHPNELTFNTQPNMELEQAVTLIQGWLKEVAGKTDDFTDKIRKLNEKLAEEAAK